ncbi:protein-methionine-sulfoxide reductase catalytic subunit MsrP [Chloroflexales bacterium ZM16-3]|nr:protein-methionine-sulfoxide reductase catalytic subunit MsrP [Chloroflexales bacterium ZM16-3]
MIKIPSSEITPEHVYLSRRAFMAGAGTLAAGALLAACGVASESPAAPPSGPAPVASKATDELGDPLNSYEQITTYNNFYEFSTDKAGPARMASGFKTSPWEVAVGGLVNKPQTFAMEDLLKQFDQEERIYRLRCVEAWSMVIPWRGFSLSKLLKAVEPKAEAKFVRFETLYDPNQLPGQQDGYFPWPYVEGLRVDEAMHDLTLLATGLYGRDLTPQNGAPIRLAVPWKYGFKSIKSIVKIDLVDTMPTSLWMASSPGEYGFYANVNPDVSHPRWSQSSERRIGELGRHKTLPFNGYADEVASLYAGMDLKLNF